MAGSAPGNQIVIRVPAPGAVTMPMRPPIALTIALPFLAVMLLTNVVLGVLARVAPQINIFAVGFPMTILVGLVTLFLLLPYIETPLRSALERALAVWIN